MKKGRKMIKVIKIILVLAVMTCIFYLSSQPATESRALSNKVLEELRSYFQRITDLVPFIYKFYIGHPAARIRKLAHFIIYLVLGLVSYLVVPKQWSGRRKIACVISFCFVYAVTDELHQYFVPGRAAEIRDVLIDTFGSSIGISIGYVLRRLRKNKEK